jgi:signal transduction histidine kinase/ActR/RegA family two-component response regulator
MERDIGRRALFDRQDLESFEEEMIADGGLSWARCVTLAAIALGYAPLVGRPLALSWLAACLILIRLVFWWFRRSVSTTKRPHLWLTGAVFSGASLYLAMGSIAVFACLKGGVWGLFAGQFMLFCLLLSASRARRSMLLYYAAAAPIAAYMFALSCVGFILAPAPEISLALLIGAIFLLTTSQRIAAASQRLILSADAARAAAEASVAAKSAFIATVSHELRTPISGIMAGAAELETAAADVRSRNNAALVSQSAQMMRTLLNDLLDLAKIEAGRLGVEFAPFNLRAALLDTIRFWRPELARKNLFLRLQGARAIPRWVDGDATRLRQILNNLLSNAAKFTTDGGVTLRASFNSKEDGHRLSLEVIDTGPGMTDGDLGRLFTAYEQLSASTADTHGGTGLGLNISRELARLMGGDIVASSLPGQGSIFRIELDIIPCATPEAVQAELGDDGCAARRLLIVDDHEVNRRAFSLILEPFAEYVACAEDAEQALNLLAVEAFDVVLMDIHMPGLDGREATVRLRSTPGPNQHTPVIALTGAGARDQVASYLAAGMTSLVVKPVSALELIAAVNIALSPGGDACDNRLTA